MIPWQDVVETRLPAFIEASTRLGLISDFDGVLSPIVEDRNAAHLPDRRRLLLAQLAEHLPVVALVSGRGTADLYSRVRLPELHYFGNHGMEEWRDGAAHLLPIVGEFRPALEALRDSIELSAGMEIEDKGASLAIHYRNTPEPDAIPATYRPLLGRLSDEHGLTLSEGRMIFEVKPPIEVNKGTALENIVRWHALDAVIYLGDDTTDVDAMQAAAALRRAETCDALNLGVVDDESPDSIRQNADYFLSDPDDVEGFFAWLLAFISRKAS